ncbi:DUF881 domain-containing protein [Aquipuribacter nitratireducens]|uniref:DUF881 domain-containing protein n=1 Tax=Aquipuribacter nitratireducens TaxID=650104 RepID=A0ABW0GU33_9MICO
MSSPYHPDSVERRDAWRRLRGGLGGRPGRFQVLAAVLLFALGFAVVTQARETSETGLTALRQTELVRLLDDVSERRERLEEEATALREQREALLTSSDAAAEAAEAARQRLDVYAVLAGTAPARGPGLTMVVTDVGERTVTAAFMLDMLQELRDAGAEAVQVNDVRVVASTWFADGEDGSVVVDGTPLTSPFTVRAIGDPDVLEPAMRIPGGVVSDREQRGDSVVITELDDVVVDALRAVEPPQYARPAPPED